MNPTALPLLLFLLGLAVGSFLNVVAYRLPRGKSIVSPPSACPSCDARIAPRDNVPVLGWLLLRGACRACGAPIPWRYPLVELATAMLWSIEGFRLAAMNQRHAAVIAAGAAELFFVSALVVVFLVDLEHRTIPNEITVGGTAVALAAGIFPPWLHRPETSSPEQWNFAASAIGCATGLAIGVALRRFGDIALRKRLDAARQTDPGVDSAFGMGDVKLLAMIGAFLGWEGVVFALLLSSVPAAAVGVVLRARSGKTAVLPYGPFLAAGAYFVFLFRLSF